MAAAGQHDDSKPDDSMTLSFFLQSNNSTPNRIWLEILRPLSVSLWQFASPKSVDWGAISPNGESAKGENKKAARKLFFPRLTPHILHSSLLLLLRPF